MPRGMISNDQKALTVDDATLPVIDLGGLFSGSSADKEAVASTLGAAARTSGFFYITGHGIPDDMIEAIFAASKAFHEKPRSFKMKYWSGFTTNHRGYVPFEENGSNFPKTINFNETWDMSYEAPADHPDHLAGWRMTGPNVWSEIPGWKETVSGYYDAVFNLGLRLLDALALELGVETEELTRRSPTPRRSIACCATSRTTCRRRRTLSGSPRIPTSNASRSSFRAAPAFR